MVLRRLQDTIFRIRTKNGLYEVEISIHVFSRNGLYTLIKARRDGRLTKPIVAWCIGTCAMLFGSDVQFGHAGASANADAETAIAKNKALREAGFIVPDSFDGLAEAIKTTYDKLLDDGTIVPSPEVPPPTVPMDYNWARELGLIRKPGRFSYVLIVMP